MTRRPTGARGWYLSYMPGPPPLREIEGPRRTGRPLRRQPAALMDRPGSDHRPRLHRRERRGDRLAGAVDARPARRARPGVEADPAARGLGLGREVCAYVIADALAAQGTVALIADDSNIPALRLYRSLGLRYRALRAASGRYGD
jgi:ribosomal protein S18 acetylase RimI-like enzyme